MMYKANYSTMQKVNEVRAKLCDIFCCGHSQKHCVVNVNILICTSQPSQIAHDVQEFHIHLQCTSQSAHEE